MKYLKQFAIIMAFSFAGEALHSIIPLPIPASIYGIVLLFTALCTGLLKPDSVRETGKFLIEIMPIMFLPAAVGLMEDWGILKPMLAPVAIITVVTLVTVMLATGWVSQGIIRLEGRRKGGKRDE